MAPSDAQDVKSSASSERKLSAKMSAVGPIFWMRIWENPPDFFDAIRNRRQSQWERPGCLGTEGLGGFPGKPDELSELFHPPLR